MTVLIAGGDSFTYGTELQHPENAWSGLIANRLQMSYANTAQPGSSNSAIVRRVIAACEKIDIKDVVVLCMFTFPNRYEFKFNYSTKERGSPWYSISPWTHATLNQVRREMPNIMEKFLLDFIKNRKTADSTGVSNFSRSYYDNVADHEWGCYTSLKEIFILQSYLETHNIPYYFTYADNSMFDPGPAENKVFQNLIGPHDFKDFGFYQWALDNKYELGATHPLEGAHKDFADMLYNKVRETFVAT